jgi:hypothetical protein
MQARIEMSHFDTVQQSLYRMVQEQMEPDEWPSGQLVDGRTAGPILHRARVIIEEELLRRARADSAAAWLYFLRRQSREAYDAKNLRNFNYASDIAEIITGLGGGGEHSRYVAPDFSYAVTSAERLYEIEWFCKAALALKNLYRSGLLVA